MDGGLRSPSVTQLVHDHYEVVYRFAYRLSGRATDAEDLTQQTFTIACRKLDQLREPERARSWLFTIVRHVFLKSLSQSPENHLPLDSGPEPPDPGTANHIPDHIDEEQLQEALNDLPEVFRTPLLLFYFDDLSYKEIAEQLEVPIGTIMSRLARGKSFLKDRLQSTQAAT